LSKESTTTQNEKVPAHQCWHTNWQH